MDNKIINLIERKGTLSRKQQQLLDYMIQNIDDTAELTADEVAQRAGVSKATLFRTLHSWGYASLIAFKIELNNYITSVRNPNYWQMQRMLAEPNDVGLFQSSIEKAIGALNAISSHDFEAKFQHSVDLMASAPEIGVIGSRSSNFLAQYFEAIMLPTPKRVSVLTAGEQFAMDRVNKLARSSVIFVISRYPYTKLTINAAEYAYRAGHTIVLLTNDKGCNLTRIAAESLITSKSSDRYSIIPFILVIESLANELCAHFSNESLRNIDRANDALQKYGLMEW